MRVVFNSFITFPGPAKDQLDQWFLTFS